MEQYITAILTWLKDFGLLVPFILGIINNVFVENIKVGIKSAYPESNLRLWLILLFVAILGCSLYLFVAYASKNFNPIEFLSTPAFSWICYQWKPYRRIIKFLSIKSDQYAQVTDDV
jgi:hypothetical protein